MGVWPNLRSSGRDGILSLPPGTLDILAASHNSDGRLVHGETPIVTEILDSTQSVGLVKLVVGEDWYDFYLAARVEGRWRIVNGVFGPASALAQPVSETDRDDAVAAARIYVERLNAGDGAGATAHLDISRRTLSRGAERLLVQTRDSFNRLTPRRRLGESDARLLAIAPTTAAVRVDLQTHTEWVFLLKLDGYWRPVNSFWLRR